MKVNDHIDTRLLVLDDALQARIIEHTLPTNAEGCELYRPTESGWHNKGIDVSTKTDDPNPTFVSILRVAYALMTLDHVGPDEEVMHVGCSNTGKDRPMCIALDHLEKHNRADAVRERTRIMRRAGHVARMRRTLPNYART